MTPELTRPGIVASLSDECDRVLWDVSRAPSAHAAAALRTIGEVLAAKAAEAKRKAEEIERG